MVPDNIFLYFSITNLHLIFTTENQKWEAIIVQCNESRNGTKNPRKGHVNSEVY